VGVVVTGERDGAVDNGVIVGVADGNADGDNVGNEVGDGMVGVIVGDFVGVIAVMAFETFAINAAGALATLEFQSSVAMFHVQAPFACITRLCHSTAWSWGHTILPLFHTC